MLLVWLGFILTNKVGSPQYFLWIAPLLPLLPLKSAREWWWVGLMLLVMVLTTAIYPCAYAYVKGVPRPDHPGTWTGPIASTQALLTTRSFALLIATLWLGGTVWRAGRFVPTPATFLARSPRHEPDLAPRPVPIGTS